MNSTAQFLYTDRGRIEIALLEGQSDWMTTCLPLVPWPTAGAALTSPRKLIITPSCWTTAHRWRLQDRTYGTEMLSIGWLWVLWVWPAVTALWTSQIVIAGLPTAPWCPSHHFRSPLPSASSFIGANNRRGSIDSHTVWVEKVAHLNFFAIFSVVVNLCN